MFSTVNVTLNRTCSGVLLVGAQGSAGPHAAHSVAGRAQREPRLQCAEVHQPQGVVLARRQHAVCAAAGKGSIRLVSSGDRAFFATARRQVD